MLRLEGNASRFCARRDKIIELQIWAKQVRLDHADGAWDDRSAMAALRPSTNPLRGIATASKIVRIS
jgi:hypothetical protein